MDLPLAHLQGDLETLAVKWSGKRPEQTLLSSRFHCESTTTTSAAFN